MTVKELERHLKRKICISDMAYERGYLSRKISDFREQEIVLAGGKRTGDMFVRMPCHNSTQYLRRYYLKGVTIGEYYSCLLELGGDASNGKQE